MLKVIFSLSPFILLPIVTIHYPLTLLLSSSIINIVTYFKFMKFPILDIILTPPPSPYLLMNPTNHTDHLIVLLKPGTKLNAPLLPPVETPVFIIVPLPLLDDDDPDVSSSSIYHHLTQYMYVFFYQRSTTSTLLSSYQRTHRNCRSCVQCKIYIVTTCVLLQPRNINDQLEQLIPLLKYTLYPILSL